MKHRNFTTKTTMVVFFIFLVYPSMVFALDANLDFSKSIIITPRRMGGVERKAVTVLQEEIQKRTGILLSASAKWPGGKQPVIAIGLLNQIEDFAGPYVDLF